MPIIPSAAVRDTDRLPVRDPEAMGAASNTSPLFTGVAAGEQGLGFSDAVSRRQARS